MTSQPPLLCLVAGNARALNPRLLSHSNTESLTIARNAHGVRLTIFHDDSGDDEISHRLLIDSVTSSDRALEKRSVDSRRVAQLRQAHAVVIGALHRRWLVVAIDLENQVIASL